jgi:pimeloyl-ACP methyl ester carboxylesterase
MNPLPATWVLVRGLTRERTHWGTFPAALGEALHDARVITLDLPGAGTLHRERCPASVAAMVESCRTQLRALRVDGPVNLLGLSLGGMVAARWLHRWPQEVAAAVIVNTSARGLGPLHHRLRPSSWPALLRIAMRWGTRDAEHEVLRLTSSRPLRHVSVLGDWTVAQRERPVSRMNALRQLLGAARHRLVDAPPTCPVLVVCSARDALVDPQCSRVLATTWGCEIAVHAQAGHDLPLDDGAWLAARIAGWVCKGW